jgi:hypothetical protein
MRNDVGKYNREKENENYFYNNKRISEHYKQHNPIS